MSAGLDPVSNCGDFFRAKFLALAGRHDFLFAVFLEATFDHLNEQTIGAVARADCCPDFTAFHQSLETFQHELALGVFCGVAIQAMGTEDVIHGGVIDFRLRGLSAQEYEEQAGDYNCFERGKHSQPALPLSADFHSNATSICARKGVFESARSLCPGGTRDNS